MKNRIVMVVLLLVVVGGRASVAQTEAATETRAIDRPQSVTPHTREQPPKPVDPPLRVNTPPPPTRDALLERSMQLLQEQQRLIAQMAMLLPPPPRPPELPGWLLPLVLVAAAASLLAAALQPLLYRYHRAAIARCANGLPALETKVDAGMRFVGEGIQKANTGVVAKIDAVEETAMSRLTSLFVEVGDLKERIGKVAEMLEETATTPSGGGDAVRLEHEVLAEHWKQFREKKDLDSTQENPWENLLEELPPLVPAELRASLDAVLTPYREQRLLIQKIGIIPHVVSGRMRLASEAAELKRARDLVQLLISTQSTDGDSRLRFPFQTWVTDTFLPFADLYLQSYQKAHLEQRDGDLQKGVSLVRQILRLAAVEPIEVTLGETRFDSARHIGRSTSSDPHFPDGVITGVVRNGFVDGGRQVIRQPEVIVNRVR
jgi:hypothetical protein